MPDNDITSAEVVEIVIREQGDGFRLWINVDGVCKFRAYRIKHVVSDVDTKNKVETRE